MPNTKPANSSNGGHIRALVSVHDVMPETLPQVDRILSVLNEEGIAPVTLLVVPGAGWSSEGIERLDRFRARGCELAGHGWLHRVERITGLAHRMHSRLISRNVAEHLALDRVGIHRLIARCHAWFVDQGLGAPALYCPPAWAMGPIPRSTLATLPFTRYELFSGVLSAQTGRMHPVPLTGYEADTGVRTVAIRAWNRLNRRRAAQRGWIRIGIHPHDLDLRLAEDLRRDLRRFRCHAGYSEIGAA
ncbi:polysaccharide deacetylase family protein [Thiocapsa bogorovii]|uniref:polysaccharide deacetylase family protein n=1 Tax=Thiocapsa bogorovii TaxID=521689 RepID=UPI001E2DF8DB|nr:polysaccharide deacetylase family protein [Thiocapsa bogorovii]UHD17699.1 polysaccharide deacetylase family protein [Thiocapsa bogorovii]